MNMFRKKRKYEDEVHNWDIPKEGLYLGNILKNSAAFYMDENELSKHMIIAGSTGSGKSIAAQVICEELLKKDIEVMVFDPTAQWSGMLKPNEDKKIIRSYKKFNLKLQNNNGFSASIIRLKRLSLGAGKKEKLTIFDTSELSTLQLEAIIHTIIEYHFNNAKETQKLTRVIIFEEIHRILKKFGGSGEALNDIERAVREFRKWGIGIILISQVLEDFVGAIRANIATELQFKTSYEPDLKKIQTKYGDKITKSVVMAKTSHTLFHNSEYNIGVPFFLQVRPPMHQIERLSKEEYARYLDIRRKLDDNNANEHAYSALFQGKYDLAESYLDSNM